VGPAKCGTFNGGLLLLGERVDLVGDEEVGVADAADGIVQLELFVDLAIEELDQVDTLRGQAAQISNGLSKVDGVGRLGNLGLDLRKSTSVLESHPPKQGAVGSFLPSGLCGYGRGRRRSRRPAWC